MATSLMSLMSLKPQVMKHVVPWKTRQEFATVYDDLYSEDKSRQVNATHRIATWKSRVGSKLSVAIESCGCLQQVHMDYTSAVAGGEVHTREGQLKASASLALIRFVNHITEKAQTKAVAQPVHVLARDFGIPEWIVRLRHDATHGTMPSLVALMTGVDWALKYLKEEFWQKQLDEAKEAEKGEGEPDEGMGEEGKKCKGGPKKVKKLRMSKIRSALYDFQKARYQELNSPSGDSTKDEAKDDAGSVNNEASLKTLKGYLSHDRMQFIRCLLEDGILVSTPEQLAAFGVKVDDLVQHSPPTVPLEVCDFWRPLLRHVYMCGCLPLLTHTALFSVTSDPDLRSYQLTAWLIYFLAQSQEPQATGRKKKKKRQEDLVKGKGSLNLPKRTLLTACLQNVTPHTIHLLKYLVDKESLGPECYHQVTSLLHIHPEVSRSHEATLDTTSDPNSDDMSGSDSDTIYTVEDLKKEKLKVNKRKRESATIESVQNSLDKSDVPWSLCTDIVDWSTVPFGVIPTPINEDNEEDEEDTEEEEEEEEVKEVKEEDKEDSIKEEKEEDRKRRNDSESSKEENEDNRKRRNDSPSSTGDVKEDRKRRHNSADEDGATSVSPKRSVYTPKEDIL